MATSLVAANGAKLIAAPAAERVIGSLSLAPHGSQANKCVDSLRINEMKAFCEFRSLSLSANRHDLLGFRLPTKLALALARLW